MIDDWAQKAANAIINDLCSRRGLRQEFDGIHEDIQEEIRQTWADIIRNSLNEI